RQPRDRFIGNRSARAISFGRDGFALSVALRLLQSRALKLSDPGEPIGFFVANVRSYHERAAHHDEGIERGDAIRFSARSDQLLDRFALLRDLFVEFQDERIDHELQKSTTQL